MPSIPTNMTELIHLLKSNGYPHSKRLSGVQLRLLVDGDVRHRIDVCKELARKFNNIGAKYMPNHNDSSIGAVIINNHLRINVKPKMHHHILHGIIPQLLPTQPQSNQ